MVSITLQMRVRCTLLLRAQCTAVVQCRVLLRADRPHSKEGKRGLCGARRMPVCRRLAGLDVVSGHYLAAMLPFPVSSHTRRDSKYRVQRRLRDVLLSRARITNLGFYLLAASAAFSFFINLTYYFFSEPPRYPFTDYSSPYSILATVERDSTLHSLQHLVIVPGHATWTGSKIEESFDEESWLMDSFQQGDKTARINAYYNHIVRG